ncbi:ATP-binding cassette domain-containing protein [Chitinibacter bivalviorum]|uniref:ATP-binding cassette domain-containing protein n=1 Tax=Chitinibacter bivalviorum TaxID=2739434 RepID=A0A7H9BLN0_9NEIS|nr:oligopeptide/dipeptide ABC transporter ATP-binding protein [Chitinibacter bivalviorum]QLG89276.1 ATP-binding cassette domain-containing protein [Chitinibacter bivalviorum]
MSLLDIRNLNVSFGSSANPFQAVSSLDLTVNRGEIVGIVGESGSGKSVTMLAMMGLIDAPGRVTADALQFDGQDLLNMKAAQKRQIIGKDIAMIFQDALTSLNPAYTVGFQLMETLKLHTPLRGAALKQRALELLEQVEIPDARSRLNAYPHQLSGGMSQRVMIAMAIACEPKLLIADEPTTALDVTVQAQIMELLVNLQKQNDMALILITHDLAVVAEVAQRMVVMYAGEVVESSNTDTLFAQPCHPYTQALLSSIPEHSKGAKRLSTLAGVVPGQYDRPHGCLLSPRCPYVTETCRNTKPALLPLAGTSVRCFTPLDSNGIPRNE